MGPSTVSMCFATRKTRSDYRVTHGCHGMALCHDAVEDGAGNASGFERHSRPANPQVKEDLRTSQKLLVPTPPEVTTRFPFLNRRKLALLLLSNADPGIPGLAVSPTMTTIPVVTVQ